MFVKLFKYLGKIYSGMFLIFILPMVFCVSCSTEIDNQPPLLIEFYPVLPARGEVQFVYSFEYEENIPVVVSFEYKDSQNNWQQATAASGSVQGLLGGYVSGTEYIFVWDSFKDVELNKLDTALRITAKTPYGTSRGNTETFTLQNNNLQSVVNLSSIETDPDSDIVEITLDVFDEESEEVAVSVEYSTDSGARWYDATLEDDNPVKGSPSGEQYTKLWQAKNDVKNTPANVMLRITAEDGIGKSEPYISDKFFLVFNYSELIKVDNFTQTSLKGDIPVSFRIFGDNNAKYDVKISFRDSTTPEFMTAHPSSRYLNLTENIPASPDGKLYNFFWDSEQDVKQIIDNQVVIKVELLETGGKSFDVEITDTTLPFRVNNAKVSSGPLISEVFPGVEGKGAFIELCGSPGHALDMYRLYEKWDGSKNGQYSGIAYISFDETAVIGEDGTFVIGSEDVNGVDLVPDNWGTFFQKLPQAFSLVFNVDEGDAADKEYDYDAIGIGDFNQSGFQSQGEGNPVEIPTSGKSINRDFSNTDMNDNYSDFIFLAPNPGQTNLWLGD